MLLPEFEGEYRMPLLNIKGLTKRLILNVYVYLYNWKQPLFQYIEIETVNRCNGKCSFCPANIYSDKRPYTKMDTDLFYKIIQELSEIKYCGHLALFSNNEPFLDSRIIDFAKYAREKLPHAYIFLYTNGSLLTVNKLQEILPFIDYIHIDNYNDVGNINGNILEVLLEFEKSNGTSPKINLVKRKETEVLSSRGGIAPNKKMAKAASCKCALPFIQMVIRPDGKVSLCCNDAYGQWTMGDLTKESIKGIWYGSRYAKVRKDMVKKGRKGIIPCCDSCDTIDLRMIHK